MSHIFLSIIIPTFNRCEFLRETLISVEKQIYTNWECIVIDDGSNDATENYMNELMEKNPKFKYYKRPSSFLKGANGCRNYGLTLSKGAYINWFDDDDIMLNNFLSSKIMILKEEELDFVINTGCFTDSHLKSRKKIELHKTNNLYKNYFLWELKILTPSVLFKKEFLTTHNYLFDTNLNTSHEFDFFCKIFSQVKQNQYKILNDITFLYRGHSGSTTSKNQKYNSAFKESEVTALERNFKLSNNDIIIYQSVYRLLINQFVKAIKNNHQKNIDFIKNSINNNSKKNKNIIRVGVICLLTFPTLSKLISLDRILKKIPIV